VVPVTTADDDQAGSHPILVGRKVTLRPGRPGDAPKLRAILAEPSVSRWWAEPDPVEVIEEELLGDFRIIDRAPGSGDFAEQQGPVCVLDAALETFREQPAVLGDCGMVGNHESDFG